MVPGEKISGKSFGSHPDLLFTFSSFDLILSPFCLGPWKFQSKSTTFLSRQQASTICVICMKDGRLGYDWSNDTTVQVLTEYSAEALS
jgi:hypothetical protein